MTFSANRVEIWWVNTRAVSAALDQFAREANLPTESDTASGTDASRWARIVLRLGLSRFGDRALICCPITRSAKGRPELVGPDRPTFSISYSADHIAVAIAAGGPLGIDIEHYRPIKMSQERQNSILQQAAQHGLPVPLNDEGATAGDRRFLNTWTKLEAIAKARGDGIGAVLTELKADPIEATDMFAQIDGASITVEPLSLSQEFAAALAQPREYDKADVRQLPTDLPGLRELYGAQPSTRS